MEELLGMPLSEALLRVRAAGRPAPAVFEAPPPRARHAFPPPDAWRVARVREHAGVLTLVVVPPIAPPC